MLVFRGHRSPVYHAAVSPTGEHYATTNHEGVVLWRLATGEELTRFPIYAHGGLTFSPDGGALLFFSYPAVHQGDTQTYELTRHSTPACDGLDFSPEGVLHARQYRNPNAPEPGCILRWRFPEFSALPSLTILDRDESGPILSPDGTLVATGHSVWETHRQPWKNYQAMLLWDTRTGEERGRFTFNLTRHITDIAFNPDGTWVAGVCGKQLRVWEIATGRLAAELTSASKIFHGLAFSPDGRCLATVGNDETARVWDCATWREERAFSWKVGKLLTINYTPDSMRLVASSSTGRVVVWDADP